MLDSHKRLQYESGHKVVVQLEMFICDVAMFSLFMERIEFYVTESQDIKYLIPFS